MSVLLVQNNKPGIWNRKVESFWILVVQANVHYMQTFMALWSKTITALVYTLQTGTRPPNDKTIATNCHLEHLHFCFEVCFTA